MFRKLRDKKEAESHTGTLDGTGRLESQRTSISVDSGADEILDDGDYSISGGPAGAGAISDALDYSSNDVISIGASGARVDGDERRHSVTSVSSIDKERTQVAAVNNADGHVLADKARLLEATIDVLKRERENLRTKVEDLNEQLSDYHKFRAERDQLLLRNAELSNQVEHFKKRLDEEQSDREELSVELEALKAKSAHVENNQRLPSVPTHEHNEIIAKLEESILEKNKTIKLQQQRIADIKKSVMKGDFGLATMSGKADKQGYWSDSCDRAAPLSLEASPRVGAKKQHNPPRSPPATLQIDQQTMNGELNRNDQEKINLQYLKNVIFKYITSTEVEAQRHLIKAISVLLNFTEEEERVVRETLDWRTSWLASLPLLGSNLRPSLPSTSSPHASGHRPSKHNQSEVTKSLF